MCAAWDKRFIGWAPRRNTSFVIGIVGRFAPQPERRGWLFAVVYTALAGIQILIGYLPGFPWRWLGANHLCHHTWLWLSFGVRASAWSLFAIGVAALVLQTGSAPRCTITQQGSRA